MTDVDLKNSPLGKNTPYLTTYAPALLFAIPRRATREKNEVPNPPPFDGVDIWNAYELSWLTPSGKPVVAIGEITLPAQSPNLIESKSLKIYLHSFNQTPFKSVDEVQKTIQKDLSDSCGGTVTVRIFLPSDFSKLTMGNFAGESLDELEISTSQYQIDSSLLKVKSDKVVEECLYSHLLKSNCLVTSQPDWGYVSIQYKGPQIDRAALLKYIVSFRNHDGFHEQCIERIFMDILKVCRPEKLSVYGRYTRRGGLDINPFRSNWEQHPPHNMRLHRQ